MTGPDEGPEGAPETIVERLSERLPGSGWLALRRARAARLARLRGAAAAPAEDPAELADFLCALRAATRREDPPEGGPARLPEGPPEDLMMGDSAGTQAAPAEAAPPAAAVLPFHRGPDRASDRMSDRLAGRASDCGGLAPAQRSAAGDLDRLPGVGPGLVWALERAGVARLADLAAAAPDALAERLGPLGPLLDLPGWIGFARAAAAPCRPFEQAAAPPPG